MNGFFDVVFGLWPAKLQWLLIPMARLWILGGSLLLIFESVMAIRHYGFGLPFYDRKTGELLNPATTLTTFLLLSAVGAFFVVAGILLHRWKSA